jgi:drug/metabolite transporter (DMT)-like permease
MLVLCAAACESTFNTLSRVFAVKAVSDQKEPSSPIAQTAIVSAIALFLCLIPASFEHPLKGLWGIGLMGWMALLWYGVFVTALAFFCWYSGIKRCGAFTAAAFSGMMPFTSMLLSALVLGESVGYKQWLGGFLVIVSMILIGTDRMNTTSLILDKTQIRIKEQIEE